MIHVPIALVLSFVLFGQSTNPNSLRVDFGTSFFRQGLESRADALTARRHFSEAAEVYDSRWTSGNRTRAVALMRGRSHYLAGDLPKAIRAFHDGLEIFPWDADLQQGLAICRTAVAYPTESEPVERVRPDATRSLRHRVSPWDLVIIATIASMLVVIGLARRLTAADDWSLPVAALGVTGVLAVVAACWHIEYDRQQEVVVLTTDTMLRTGNGVSYPPRLEMPLPYGTEVRELSRRGGWVQVEIPGGAAGWVPESAVLASEK